jgi:hypothetical protein
VSRSLVRHTAGCLWGCIQTGLTTGGRVCSRQMEPVSVTCTCNPSYSGSWFEVCESLSWIYPTQNQCWWSGSSGKSACLASVRPWVQTLVPQKKLELVYSLGFLLFKVGKSKQALCACWLQWHSLHMWQDVGSCKLDALSWKKGRS